VQHEFYHQYTADEHTLMCLEQLDRIWEAKAAPHNAYTELFQSLERPFTLYLALLLHDVGKPRGHGNHSEVSAELAMRVARRLGLDGATTHTLRLVIEHHLLLASVSQRRDLDDPAVIRQVAKEVQSAETLTLLTLHTFVDSLATSDKLWNGFKDSLLWSLHKRVKGVMAGATEFVLAEEKQRELLQEEVQRDLPPQMKADELEAHFTTLPPRYFQIHSAREVLRDVALTHLFMRRQLSEEGNGLAPAVNWHNEPDRGYCAVKVATWDRAGLFTKIAGSHSAAGMNILSAQIFTRSDGIVLDTFFVNDARTGALPEAAQRDKFEEVLNQALGGEPVDFHALIARQKITRPLYLAYTGERIQTRIHVDNEVSETRTLIEIETEDRVGLLYEISHTLSELELDISAAKILTEKGGAIDAFYVRELDGSKVVDPHRLSTIEHRLRQAIKSLEHR
jgi:[protein-PII] uridylyltransferase